MIAPGLVGLLRYLKARLQRRRRGLTFICQPYRNLYNRWKKIALRPETSSCIFAAGPTVLFACYGLLAFLTPVFHQQILISADLITIVYILAFARFVLNLAALDADAPFGGLGSSRDMFLHFLTEIGLILIIGGLAIRGNTVSLAGLVEQHWTLGLSGMAINPELVLLGMAFAMLILFESGRLPIENPETHLELTMTQKAIILEYSGWDLALIEWAEMVKLTFLLTLLSHLFLPFSLLYPLLPASVEVTDLWVLPLALISWLAKVGLMIIALALWESSQPKYRLRIVVGPALFAMALSLTAIIYFVATTLER